jgi:hypothetical protein
MRNKTTGDGSAYWAVVPWILGALVLELLGVTGVVKRLRESSPLLGGLATMAALLVATIHTLAAGASLGCVFGIYREGSREWIPGRERRWILGTYAVVLACMLARL